jgi:Type VI secretion system (T6SS), amidase effector protein 4
VAAIKFETIWKNYSDGHPCQDRKTGEIPHGYENQCAIRVGYALEKSGVSFASFRGCRCPKAGRSSGLVASAQELADWLGPSRFPGCSNAETYTGKNAFDKIKDRTAQVGFVSILAFHGMACGPIFGSHRGCYFGPSNENTHLHLLVRCSRSPRLPGTDLSDKCAWNRATVPRICGRG